MLAVVGPDAQSFGLFALFSPLQVDTPPIAINAVVQQILVVPVRRSALMNDDVALARAFSAAMRPVSGRLSKPVLHCLCSF